MKYLSFAIILLLSLALTQGYEVPDYDYDNTDPDCDNISVLLANAQSDLIDMKHYVGSTLPGRLAKLKNALATIQKTCSIIQDKRPSLVQFSSRDAKKRIPSPTFLVETSRQLKAIKSSVKAEFDESKDHLMMKLLSNLLSDGSNDPAEICGDNKDAINALVDYIDWLMPALTKSYVQGSLQDRINSLNAFDKKCNDCGHEEAHVEEKEEEQVEEEEEEQQRHEEEQAEEREEEWGEEEEEEQQRHEEEHVEQEVEKEMPMQCMQLFFEENQPNLVFASGSNKRRFLNVDASSKQVSWKAGSASENEWWSDPTLDSFIVVKYDNCKFYFKSVDYPGYYLHASSTNTIDLVASKDSDSALWYAPDMYQGALVLSNFDRKFKGTMLSTDANGNVFLGTTRADGIGWFISTYIPA